MAAHWTYDEPSPSSDLDQGDILKPSPGLRSLFAEVHPHFCHEKYLGFLVATQSCDLVRRRKSPKALYINLAAIRPLSQVIDKIIGHVATPVAPRRFRSRDKLEARRLIERLLNQNEQGVGLFFLYPDADFGIAEPAVAFLRVTVSVRAQHYQTLIDSRVGRLKPEFRAKLGWLLGNLYDRPATPDWSDQQGGQAMMDRLIVNVLSDGPEWIDDEIVEQAIANKIDLATAKADVLESLKPPSRIERALAEVAAEMAKVDPGFAPNLLQKLQNRLRNNGKFVKAFQVS